MNTVRSTFKPDDVTLLLSDITGLVTPLPASEREKFIQSGVHYCEMLPLEKKPSQKYLDLYKLALERFSEETAEAAAVTAEKILLARNSPVLVSLARAGIPAGILIKRYIKAKYGRDVPHYAVSIIRGKGIDKNAIQYIISRHKPEDICFVDGWTGKGAILRTLREALSDHPQIPPQLAVLADPAGAADFYGTREDFLIACSCLNCTVSGLISRTFYRKDIIGENDFHGCAYYGELESEDRTYEFIDRICGNFNLFSHALPGENKPACEQNGLAEAENIAREFGVRDINFVKPGLGETTRVLLRRVPWKVLVRDKSDTKYIGHILQMAKEAGVDVLEYPLKNYRACGIIKNLSDL